MNMHFFLCVCVSVYVYMQHIYTHILCTIAVLVISLLSFLDPFLITDFSPYMDYIFLFVCVPANFCWMPDIVNFVVWSYLFFLFFLYSFQYFEICFGTQLSYLKTVLPSMLFKLCWMNPEHPLIQS